jgi:hypothetical protein
VAVGEEANDSGGAGVVRAVVCGNGGTAATSVGGLVTVMTVTARVELGFRVSGVGLVGGEAGRTVLDMRWRWGGQGRR